MSYAGLKFLYYFCAIANHIIENVSAWQGYLKGDNMKEFSAIPNNSDTAHVFFLFCCIFGSLFCVVVLVIYINLCNSNSNENEYQRGYLEYELGVAVCQLVFKDAVQSIFMFIVYMDGDVGCASLLTKRYAICSLVSHTKLLITFVMKYVKYDSEVNYDCGTKLCFSFLGGVGAIILVVFTTLFLVDVFSELCA